MHPGWWALIILTFILHIFQYFLSLFMTNWLRFLTWMRWTFWMLISKCLLFVLPFVYMGESKLFAQLLFYDCHYTPDGFCIHFEPYCNIHLCHLRFHFFAEAASDFFFLSSNHNFGIVHPVEIVLGCNSISLLRFPLCSHVYNYLTSIFCLLLGFE